MQRSAECVATDEMKDAHIEAEAGVSRMTLHRWKLRPDFRAGVAEHRDAFRRELERDTWERWARGW